MATCFARQFEVDKKIMRSSRNLPVYFSTDIAECGVACLAMILVYYGIAVSPSLIRPKLYASSRGARFGDLLRAAREFGLNGEAYRAPLAGLDRLKTPLIAHVRQNHFVVLAGINKYRVEIHDPAAGRYVLSKKDFEKLYSGVVMSFSRDERENHETTPSRAINPSANTRPPKILQFAPFVGALDTLPACVMLFASRFLEISLVGGQVRAGPTFQAFALLAIASGILFIGSRGLAVGLSRRGSLMVALRIWSGDIDDRIVRQRKDQIQWLNTVADKMFEILNKRAEILSCIFVGLFVFLYISVLDWRVAAIEAIVSAAALLSITLVAPAQRAPFRMNVEHIAARFRKAVSRSGAVGPRWASRFWREIGSDASRLAGWRSAVEYGLKSSVSIYAPTMAILICALFAIISFISIGRDKISMDILLSISIFLICTWRVLEFLKEAPAHVAHFDRICGLLSNFAPSLTAEPSPLKGAVSIHVKDVSFSYGVGEVSLFTGLNLKFPRGQLIALKGKPSSGKSTLLRLIMGLESPRRGVITWRDASGTICSTDEAEGAFGYISQESELLRGTILQNITGFSLKPDLDRAVECARHAQIDGFINSVPMRYEAHVYPGGGNFSESERIKIMFARSFYGNPSVLFIDEEMRKLDDIDRTKIFQHLRAMDVTVVAVSGNNESLNLDFDSYIEIV